MQTIGTYLQFTSKINEELLIAVESGDCCIKLFFMPPLIGYLEINLIVLVRQLLLMLIKSYVSTFSDNNVLC